MNSTPDPFALFAEWFEKAKKSEPSNPNAMCLATSTKEGVPSARMVLLKGFDAKGFVFYTNLESRKGQELAKNFNVALCFYWKTLDKQVRIEGKIEPVSTEEADAYFKTRSREARIGAWASKQSRPLEGMKTLLVRVAKYAAQYAVGEVPRPEFWSGFRVIPSRIEFWQQGDFRLHTRQVYTREGVSWKVGMLYP